MTNVFEYERCKWENPGIMETAPRFCGTPGVQPWVGATGWNQTLIPWFILLLLQPMANKMASPPGCSSFELDKYKPIMLRISFPGLNPPPD